MNGLTVAVRFEHQYSRSPMVVWIVLYDRGGACAVHRVLDQYIIFDKFIITVGRYAY